MKRLLLISYPFPPNASAGAVRSERIARYLREFNWKADVITIKPRSDLFEDKQRLNDIKKIANIHMTNIFDPWLWLKDKSPNNIITRASRNLLMKFFSFPDHMLYWIPYVIQAGKTIAEKQNIGAIYTTSPPHSTHLAGLILAKKLKKPWIADFRDPWTLNAAHKGKGIGFAIERLLEKKVYERASLILANTEYNHQKLLNGFSHLLKNKVVTLKNGWEEFNLPVKRKTKKEQLTVLHSGKFYPKFKPYALLYAISKWKKSLQDPQKLKNLLEIKLLGAREPATKKIVEELQLNDIVHFLPWASLEEARQEMCEADILWATLGTSPETAGYIPSKLFEYIAAQKPIWGFFPKGEAESLINKTNTGKVFTSDDSAQIIEALKDATHAKQININLTYTPNIETINSYKVKSLIEKLSVLLNRLPDNS